MDERAGGLMGYKGRRLWRCPECGRRFANANQWHSCSRMSVGDHLRGKTPEAVALYRAYEAAMRECGPFRVHPTKTRIGFITRMTFAGAALKKRWIDAGFILPYEARDRRFRKIEKYGPRSYGHYLRIHAVGEIDERLRAWLCEAYRVGQQEAERT